MNVVNVIPIGSAAPAEIISASHALQAQRRIITQPCPQCGSQYSGLRTKRYCSTKCRRLAREARQRDLQAGLLRRLSFAGTCRIFTDSADPSRFFIEIATTGSNEL
jgi:hypothetical protein